MNTSSSPPATPNESPAEKPTNTEAVIVLNDRGGTITVDKNENVAGLDAVPASTPDEIAQVMLSERLEKPAILKELNLNSEVEKAYVRIFAMS